ncbi:MAG: aminotransferase class V-fold PLP-dependent enzyme [Pirellulales bacterium]
MDHQRRIYLDNAATSWPKPEAVYQAVDRYQRELGAAAGRGAYAEAIEVGREIDNTRSLVARLIGAGDPRRVVFATNGTDALNTAIHGLLAPGDHVVTTATEHNSVLRPLTQWVRGGSVEVSYVACDAVGWVDPEAIAATIRSSTRLVVISHASNVTGTLQDLEAIAEYVRESDALLLVDAAQTLGHVAVDVSELGIDLLAAPGHKGLLGPLGTGLLYVAEGIDAKLDARRQGGTGSQSESADQPMLMPDKYESGNLNCPGILGLGAGLRYLQQRGLETIEEQVRRLTAEMLAGLAEIPGVKLFGRADARHRVGVVSMALDGYDPQELAATLDASCRVQTRAGYHCAARIHRVIGSDATGGTLRFSFGPFNTSADVTAAVDALKQLADAV